MLRKEGRKPTGYSRQSGNRINNDNQNKLFQDPGSGTSTERKNTGRHTAVGVPCVEITDQNNEENNGEWNRDNSGN